MSSPFFNNVIKAIQQIPHGKIATYGQIAIIAGNYRAARQVAWILSTSCKKYNLPWHRVINSKGKISLKPGKGYELQKDLLEEEGIQFDPNDKIDFEKYGWHHRVSK